MLFFLKKIKLTKKTFSITQETKQKARQGRKEKLHRDKLKKTKLEHKVS